MMIPVVGSVRYLQDDILASSGVHPAPASTEVFRLKIAKVEKTPNILRLTLIMFGGTLIVILEKVVSLIEMVVDSHVKSVPAIEIHHRT